MAYTEIYYFNKNGAPKEQGIAPQASCGGWKVWYLLKEKYLPEQKNLFSSEQYQKVWDLAKDERLTREEKIILISTFDYAIVYKKDFDELINAFEKFNAEYENQLNFGRQIELFKEIKNKKNSIAIWWNQTSVNADNWRCIWNRSNHSSLYNLFKEDKHFDVFELLERNDNKLTICIN